MSPTRNVCLAALATVVCTTAVDHLEQSTPLASWPEDAELIVLNDNGAWSFFEDERAVVDHTNETLLVSSVANGSGTGGAARHGDVEVVQYEFTTGAMTRSTLADRLQADDHDSAALYVRPDGHYLAMYSRHDADTVSRWRVSARPGDAASWDPPDNHDHGAPTSYSNLYAARGGEDSAGRLYAFTRTEGRDPHFLVSDDHGSTWQHGGRLLEGPGRPYVRYTSDGAHRIHLVTTEQHPDDFANSVYHAVVEDGRLMGSDGSVIDDDLADARSVAPDALTPVFVSDGADRAWTLDVEVDHMGRPYVAFSVRSPGRTPADADRHRYFYAGYDGERWRVSFLAHAGGVLYPAQASYTGLVALHPTDPSRVFVSTDVDPSTGSPLVSAVDGEQHHELFEGVTRDRGSTWSWTALTRDSVVDNIRPVVPLWESTRTAVLWLRGSYTTYRDYDLDVVATFLPDGRCMSPLG